MKATLLMIALLGATAASAQGTLVTNALELRTAIAGAQPGDTIVMADGRWTDIAVVLRTSGTEADSVRLVAQTPGNVILDGASTLRFGGDYLVVDGLRFEGGTLSGGNLVEFRNGSTQANHSRLTNTAIVDVGASSSTTDTKWVSLYGTHNRVDHNYIEGKTNDGATLVVWLEDEADHEPTYHRIDHNHFGPRPPLGRNGGETIRIGTSSTSMQDAFVTVERNLFDRCDGEIEIISNKSGQNVYRSNTFLRSRGSLTLRHGNGARVEGNVFLGHRVSDTGGVRVIGEDHVVVNNYFEFLEGTGFRSAITIMNGVPNSPLNRYFQVRDAVIAHNTIVQAREALTIGAGQDSERTLPPENVAFHNNVILSQGRTIVDEEDAPIDMTWDGTVYWGGALGIEDPPGIANVNPLLDPTGDDIWRPLDGSPLLDGGAAVPGLDLSIDLDGQPRDGTPDIGADERSDAPIVLRPLQPADVGPVWRGAVSEARGPEAVATLALGTPYPNPAASLVTVPLRVDRGGRVDVAVYDALGRRVAVLLAGRVPVGTHALRLDAAGLAPGAYRVVARLGGDRASASVVILARP